MSTIRGVLLDIDGTLVDSNDAHAHAWVKAITEAGISISFEEIRVFLTSFGLEDMRNRNEVNKSGSDVAKSFSRST